VRIAIFLSQLRGAGIQRMRLNIIELLIERGFEVDLVVTYRQGELLGHVPENVQVFELASAGKLFLFNALFKYLKTRRPSHIMSSYEDISVAILVFSRYLRFKPFILISTHNALSKLEEEKGYLNYIKQRLLILLMRKYYPLADALVAVSGGVATEMRQLLKLPEDRIRVIYNPVIATDFESRLDDPAPVDLDSTCPGAIVGYFGRLHPQKRVDLLIDAFPSVIQKQDSTLLLVGDGPQRAQLERQVQRLDLEKNVIFFGFAPNPYPLMRRCDLVVLPSDYEGLGNVLIEAMACGTQVVSTDCPYGPSEILEGGRWGQLVPTGDAVLMARAIMCALSREYWIAPESLKDRGMNFTSLESTQKYLEAMNLL
jgi:glycosyltransferase involved in cell wall biosynthesis